MKTAAEYRAMAEECFKWAREVRTKEVRASYLQLAQVWLDTASKLDGLPPTRTASVPDERVTTKGLINLKTAKTLGVDVPPGLSARADDVIE